MCQHWSVLTGIPAHSEGRSSLPGDQRQTHWDWEITTTAGAHALPAAFIKLMHEVKHWCHIALPCNLQIDFTILLNQKMIFAFMH